MTVQADQGETGSGWGLGWGEQERTKVDRWRDKNTLDFL